MKTKISLTIFSLLCAASTVIVAGDGEHKVITPEEFQTRMQQTPGKILDVRTPQEFDSGHIKGAENLNFFDAKFQEQIKALPKEGVVYYVYCASGGRSGKTLAMMKEAGFHTVYDMEGGMRSWTAKDLPQEQ